MTALESDLTSESRRMDFNAREPVSMATKTRMGSDGDGQECVTLAAEILYDLLVELHMRRAFRKYTEPPPRISALMMFCFLNSRFSQFHR